MDDAPKPPLPARANAPGVVAVLPPLLDARGPNVGAKVKWGVQRPVWGKEGDDRLGFWKKFRVF